jgi:hypothetical protein
VFNFSKNINNSKIDTAEGLPNDYDQNNPMKNNPGYKIPAHFMQAEMEAFEKSFNETEKKLKKIDKEAYYIW